MGRNKDRKTRARSDKEEEGREKRKQTKRSDRQKRFYNEYAAVASQDRIETDTNRPRTQQ